MVTSLFSQSAGFIERSTESGLSVNASSSFGRRLPTASSLDDNTQWANYPILQLIEDAEPHSWRVFVLGGLFSKRVLLINFERIFWHRYMGSVICLRNNGNGMWHPERWAVNPHEPDLRAIWRHLRAWLVEKATVTVGKMKRTMSLNLIHIAARLLCLTWTMMKA